MPSGSARVRSTARVCGRQSASARKTCPFLAGPPGQRHRLGGGGGLVQQRRAGPRQRGQVGDHGLEVQQRLEAALGDLRLIRGVRGVPGRVLQHVAADDGRGDGVVVAQADHRGEHLVPAGHPAQLGQGLGFGERIRQAELGGLGSLGQGGGGELAERGVPQAGEHVPLLGGRRADVANSEVCHRSLPGTNAVAGSPSVTEPGNSGCPLQRCLSRPVRVPERFRGCCPFGARSLRVDSPGRCHQQLRSYPTQDQIVGRRR